MDGAGENPRLANNGFIMKILRGANVFDGRMVDLHCQDGEIHEVVPSGNDHADFQAGWIAPALFDLQINGAMGVAFSDSALDQDGNRLVMEHCAGHGIGGICPTLITNSYTTLFHGFSQLAKACQNDQDLAAFMPCFHLEGPYLSHEDGPRGAHSLEHIRKPDLAEFQRLQDAALGRIKLVTLAPELDGALRFIEDLVRLGVRVAIGHTAATPQVIRDAIKAGASLSTHLGNGSHAMWPRHENYFFEQLAQDGLAASFISDGHHLPLALVKIILRAKPLGQLIITCDASSLAGVKPGRYTCWGKELEVLAGGKVVVPGTPFLAGSGVFTDSCIRFLLNHQLANLNQAIRMATVSPMEYLGLKPWVIASGSPSNLVLFDSSESDGFKVVGTLVGDRWYPSAGA